MRETGSIARRQPGNDNRHEPSLTDSLEHLFASSQAVVTKRIDLALLEGKELVSRSLINAALLGVAVFLGAVGWIAGVWALVLQILPQYGQINQFGAFAAINAVGAVACVLIARRQFGTPIAPPRSTTARNSETADPGAGGN